MAGTRWAPRVPDGSLEALKWLALLLMTGDHINTYLLEPRVPALYAAGRLAFPLFAFVLAYNLARPGALESGRYRRVATRLALFGALASVPVLALGQLRWHWWPLNILVTFLVAVGVMALLERGGAPRLALAALLFIVGGAVVDYLWYGVALTLAAWAWLRQPSPARLALWVVLVAALSLNVWLQFRTPPSLSLWALAAVPLVFAAARVDLGVPHTRWAFYAYYPAHLAALWGWREIAG